MLECVINLAEGRRLEILDEFSAAAGTSLRDRHADPTHHRSVFTLINDAGPLAHDVRRLLRAALSLLDLRGHEGVHPRLGVVDVVPFVALSNNEVTVARRLRDETARWLAEDHGVPTFLYGALEDGTTRTLPEIRRRAFVDLFPDYGPARPDARAGATAVGERGVLMAWNLWIQRLELAQGRRMASALRSPRVRALAFDVSPYTQLSFNLLEPATLGPSELYDLVAASLPEGATIHHAELVGLAPAAVLTDLSEERRRVLGLSPGATIEAHGG